MGQVCSWYEHPELFSSERRPPTQDPMLLKDISKPMFSDSTDDQIGRQLYSIKSFMPDQEELGYLPEQIRAKHIEMLLEIRTTLEQKMLSHIDKYDGFCPEKEELVCLQLAQDKYIAVHSINGDKQRAPLEAPFESLSKCQQGSVYNRQMHETATMLYHLGYRDRENDVAASYVHSWFIQLDD